MNISETSHGLLIETASMLACLGNKNSSLSELQKSYPHLQFKTLKQTHSDIVLETESSSEPSRTGDAHWTKEKSLALCCVTADCVPVLIYSHQPRLIASIHAGWRGVACRIIPKTIFGLQKRGVQPENLNILIGPHIQLPSFEVGNDVRDQLLESIKNPAGQSTEHSFWKHLSAEKSLVDLNAIVKSQLAEFNCQPENIFCEFKDTKTDSHYHSFRRDKDRAGRQISWIVLK